MLTETTTATETATVTDADFDLFGDTLDFSGDFFMARTVESAPVTRPTRSKVALRSGRDLA